MKLIGRAATKRRRKRSLGWLRRLVRHWSPRSVAGRAGQAAKRWSPKRVAGRLVRRSTRRVRKFIRRWSPKQIARRLIKRVKKKLIAKAQRMGGQSTVRQVHRGPLTDAKRMFRKNEVALTWKELADRLATLMPEAYRQLRPASAKSLLGGEGVRSRLVSTRSGTGPGCNLIDIERAIEAKSERTARYAKEGRDINGNR